jgi:hypothetical protein
VLPVGKFNQSLPPATWIAVSCSNLVYFVYVSDKLSNGFIPCQSHISPKCRPFIQPLDQESHFLLGIILRCHSSANSVC